MECKCDQITSTNPPFVKVWQGCPFSVILHADRVQFSDATSSTKVKYKNVDTGGNVVWDCQCLSGIDWRSGVTDKSAARAKPRSTSASNRAPDDLPEFHVLTTDDDRERKAKTRQPGTFGVVVTPDSFSDLLEYAASTSSPASRRPSVQSQVSSLDVQTASPYPPPARRDTDPNVVILDRFEDTLCTRAVSLSFSPGTARTVPSIQSPTSTIEVSPFTQLGGYTAQVYAGLQDRLLSHFREYISIRLFEPSLHLRLQHVSLERSMVESLELEASQYQPVGAAHRTLSRPNADTLASYSTPCVQ